MFFENRLFTIFKKTAEIIFFVSFVFANVSLFAHKIGLETVVTFNTVCAKCHEGECSGRLSFGSGEEKKSFSHIHNYAKSDPKMSHDLYLILKYMKERCAYYPMGIKIPKNGVLNRTILDSLKVRSGNAYFIPLGMLSEGKYRIVALSKARHPVHAQIISSDFDTVSECTLFTGANREEIELSIPAKKRYFLRLKSNRPIDLEEVRIIGMKSKKGIK